MMRIRAARLLLALGFVRISTEFNLKLAGDQPAYPLDRPADPAGSRIGDPLLPRSCLH
jgi:hypothetical protein